MSCRGVTLQTRAASAADRRRRDRTSPSLAMTAAATASSQPRDDDPVASLSLMTPAVVLGRCAGTASFGGTAALRRAALGMAVRRGLRGRDRWQRGDLEELVDHRGDPLVQHAARLGSGARREEHADRYTDEERTKSGVDDSEHGDLLASGSWAGSPRVRTP